MIRKTSMLAAALLLSGCVAATGPSPDGHETKEAAVPAIDIKTRLESSAEKIERMLIDLQEARQKPPGKTAAASDDKEADRLAFEVTIAWQGEIEPVLAQLTKAVGLDFSVVGKPAAPVLVSVDLKGVTVLEAYRLIGMQAGEMADIIYRPGENKVELVYVANR